MPRRIVIDDEVSGPPGEHLVEQFWHFGADAAQLGLFSFQIGARAILHLTQEAEIELSEGWRLLAKGDWTQARPLVEYGTAEYRKGNVLLALPHGLASSAHILAQLGVADEADTLTAIDAFAPDAGVIFLGTARASVE
jgi:hypothetical protein